MKQTEKIHITQEQLDKVASSYAKSMAKELEKNGYKATVNGLAIFLNTDRYLLAEPLIRTYAEGICLKNAFKCIKSWRGDIAKKFYDISLFATIIPPMNYHSWVHVQQEVVELAIKKIIANK